MSRHFFLSSSKCLWHSTIFHSTHRTRSFVSQAWLSCLLIPNPVSKAKHELWKSKVQNWTEEEIKISLNFAPQTKQLCWDQSRQSQKYKGGGKPYKKWTRSTFMYVRIHRQRAVAPSWWGIIGHNGQNNKLFLKSHFPIYFNSRQLEWIFFCSKISTS